MSKMKKVLAIVGPTAVGKTAMSIKVAQNFNGEVISGDSMQVYRKLDIGTAKITDSEKQGVPHHLINIRDITERYSVADFIHDATEQIAQITSRGHLPIIVGGTGFYLQALLDGLELGGDQYTDDGLRKKLYQIADTEGNMALHNRLASVDPKAAAQISANNVRRVIRALEVYRKTDHLFSDQTNNPQPFDSFVVGLNTDRKLLYQRINQRVDIMMKSGLIDEARYLFNNGGTELQAGKGIGYHEFYDYFAGTRSLEDAVELVKKDSRHYAKRQLTWFRNKTHPAWYNVIEHPDDKDQLILDIDKWLRKKI
ncbi:tRNA dimethylallyltransferase [Lentilactobacillus rapi DSM 19907 = JCM 15042]|nr:tRNA dimethylallyltransferase [Lentilactobacillus rapi DSM 19907 = JCM 15042]